MRKIFFIISSIFFLWNVGQAQQLHWSYVEIPDDSLLPVSLTFYDSLHGYLEVNRSTYDNAQQYFYETIDGGKTWIKSVDTLLSTSLGFRSPGSGGSSHNSRMIYANLNSRYLSSYWQGEIPLKGYVKPIHSTDAGKTWQGKKDSISVHPYYDVLQTFDPYNLLVFDRDSGILRQTTNAGMTYSRIGDSTYLYSLYHLQLDSNYQGYGKYSSDWGQSISFDNSDRFHWTVTVNRLNEFVTNPRNHPLSLQTLVTENFGKTWKEYLTNIPGQDTLGRTVGTLQYIKGTPYLYYFTGEHGEGGRGYGTHFSTADYGDAMIGINWMYSTDYGKSWEIYRKYGDRRRAFEAVKQNEIWITVRKDSGDHSYSNAATIIARTTDNGLTWQEDIRTLRNDGVWDGRIITFSDPNHGWLAATDAQGIYSNHLFVFRYDASEQGNNSVDGYITETNQAFLKIYPNPSLTEVHLLLPTSKPITKVEFYDLMGRQDYPPYQLQGNLANVDVKNLPQGTYIARVNYLYKGYNGMFTLPLIVQH